MVAGVGTVKFSTAEKTDGLEGNEGVAAAGLNGLCVLMDKLGSVSV